MLRIQWEVRYTSAPSAVRYCKRCAERTAFMPTGLFRVNAQQKALDIWLIYKCGRCKTTWNMTVLSRVRPTQIPAKALEGYHANDTALAREVAMNAALVRKNGAEPGAPEYTLHGEPVPEGQCVELCIVAEPSDVRLAAVLREILGLSRSAFDRRVQNHTVVGASGEDIRKRKLGGRIVIQIKPE